MEFMKEWKWDCDTCRFWKPDPGPFLRDCAIKGPNFFLTSERCDRWKSRIGKEEKNVRASCDESKDSRRK